MVGQLPNAWVHSVHQGPFGERGYRHRTVTTDQAYTQQDGNPRP